MKTLLLCAVAALAASSPLPSVAAPASPLYHLINKISLPGADGWDYLSADSQAHRLYVSRGTHIAVVDTQTGKVARDIPDLSGVHGVAVDDKIGRGFTSNGRSNSVTIFDLKTLKKIADVSVGEGADAIIFEPVSGRVFTFNGRAHTATAINATTGIVVGTVILPGRPEAPAVDSRGHLYDNIEDKSEIVEIDPTALAVTRTWPIAPGEHASRLAIDSKNRRLFAVCDNQKLAILDADSGKLIATPTIGSGPDACEFDPSLGLIFSPNGEDGTLTIIHEDAPDKYTTVGTIPTQTGARTIALDAKTHHLFTVTAQAVPPPPGTQRWHRQYVDGTFVVLEYAPERG